MKTYDIIGDIHGHAVELKALLEKLGYTKDQNGIYAPPEPDRQVVFLGDFIDRGPENFEVIDIAKAMINAGYAHAIMGNHDLNAGLFHTHEMKGGELIPLREHSDKNKVQHASFLNELRINPQKGREHIDWLKSLPVVLELDGLRFAHAMWHKPSIRQLQESSVLTPSNTIHPDKWPELGDEAHPSCKAIDLIAKGLELDLPPGTCFTDSDGHQRTTGRVKWWHNADDPNLTMDKAVLHVVPGTMDHIPLSDELREQMRDLQDTEGRTMFFGHYWQRGATPTIECKNAICIDQSVAKDGHLAAATVVTDNGVIQDMQFTSVKSRSPVEIREAREKVAQAARVGGR
ncbi:MAG: metallophosphoesterase [Rickettsiales bacterium]|nr:metallophosphoesterase [Rickettsiales bacterium]